MRSHLPIEAAFEWLDFVPLGVFVLDSELTVLFWNTCLEEWTKIPRQEIIGQQIDRHFPHLNQPKYLSRLHQIFDGGRPVLFSSQLHPHLIPIVRPNGQLQVQQTIVTAKPGATEGEFFALWSIQDITDLSNQVSCYKAEQIKAQKNEAALRESEERWQLALHGNHDGIWDWNIQTNEVFFSGRWKKMLGFTDQEITNHAEEWSKRVHPDDLTEVMQAIQAHLTGAVPFYSSEYRLQCKDGSYKWILGRGQALRDDAGHPVRMVGSHTDITDRKQVEQALQESEARFRTMADSAPVLIWLSGMDGLCNFFNQTWLNFTGRSLEQEFGNGWTEGVHPDDFQHCLEIYTTAFASRQSFQMDYRLRRADGEYRWILDCGTPRFTTSGKFVGFIGSCQDIHDRKISEEALRQSESTLRSFFNNEAMLMGIVELYDHDILHLSDNQTTADFFGTTTEAMQNRFASEMGIPQSHLQQWMDAYREAAQTQAPVRFEYSHDTPAGQRWLAASVCQIANSSTPYPRFSYIVEDITERKRTELALEQELMRTQILFNTSIDGIVVMNHQGDVVQTSSSFAQMLGYTVEETLKLNVADWNAQWTRAELQQIREHYLLPPVFETRHRRKDGSLYDVEISYSKVQLDGEIMHFYICRDISDRKRTEAVLRQSEEKFRMAIDFTYDWEYWQAPDQSFVYVSPSCQRITGYTPAEFMQSPDLLNQIVHPDDRAIFANHVCENVSETEFIEFRIITCAGETRWLSHICQPIYNSDGQYVGRRASNRDISDRREANLALQASEERFRILVTHAPVGIYQTDAEGKYLYVNPRWIEMTGLSLEDAQGDGWLQALHPDDRATILAEWAQAAQEDRAFNLEYRYQQPNGTVIWVSGQAIAVRDNSGAILRYFGTVMDITARKQAEVTKQALIESIPDFLVRMRRDGLQLEVLNRGAVHIMQPETQISGSFITNTMPLAIAQERVDLAQRALATHTIQTQEYQFELNGITFYEEARIAPLGSDEVLIVVRDITERYRAEQALRDSEEKFRQLAENIHQVFFILSAEGRMLYISPAYEQIWQRSCDSLYADPQSWLEAVYEEDQPRVVAALHHQISLKQPFNETYRILRDGEIRWIAVQSLPLKDETGKVIRFTGIAEDITQQKQAEVALRQSEATKQAIIQAIPDLLIRMHADGHYADFISNSKFNIINPDQIRENANIYDVLPPDLAQLRIHYTQQALKSNTAQIYEQEILIDSKQCYEEVRIVPLLQDEVLVMVRDITEHKQAEIALKLSQERLQLALEASGDGLWDWDLATDRVYLNPYYQEMLGYRPNELVMNGSVWESMIHPEDSPWVIEQLQHHLQDNSVKYSFDYRMRCKSGEWKWIADYGKVVAKDQHSKPLRMIGTHKDISDRKQKELALRQAMEAAEAANVAKSMFLANMSHELRTPLNVILGFTQVMAHDSSLTPEQLEDLRTIRRSGDHLLSLINDVLDLSKIEAGHCALEEAGFDLLSLLHGLRTMMTERAASKRLQLMFEISPAVPQFVIADEQKLRQILLNLLSNAIKFTKQGSVTLQVSSIDPNSKTTLPASSSAISLSFPSPTLLQFEVIDTGVGIAPDEQSLIFDAFVQAEAGKKTISGTGLGLTISRRLLELMHGEISVQSTPNVGSTFTCMVPVRPTSSVTVLPEQPDRTVIGLVPGQSHRRILVVDDQRENRLLMVRLLTQLGLEVREATNGQEAIYVWQAWQPDLIWMDIRMPGLDGYEATRQIRALEADTSSIIIALTAQASHSDRSLALAAGCNDYISKPFQEATLFAKLKEYLGLEYLYAELNTLQESLQYPSCPAEPDLGSLLQPNILANLAPDWLEALKDAAVCGNDRVIAELTAQLTPELAPLRDYLDNLAAEFQFELVISWVEYAKLGGTDYTSTATDL
jgi:PAS domain S-box-containing protein